MVCVNRPVVALRVWVLVCFFVLSAVTLTVAPSALALPEGRHYEMVSPPYKGGYGVGEKAIEAVAQNGEGVVFQSNGTFAGLPSGRSLMDYIARRGASGWSTGPLAVPASLLPELASVDVSPTLDTTLAYGLPGSNYEAAIPSTESEFLMRPTATPDMESSWTVAGEVIESLDKQPSHPQYLGASADFCHLFFGGLSTVHFFLPVAAESSGIDLVYEVDRGCGGEPVAVRFVGLNNAGKVASRSCEVALGTGPRNSQGGGEFNAVSVGGGEVFFTTGVKGVECVPQVFLRLGGVRTLEVSKPVAEAEGCGEEIPCKGAAKRAGAFFAGASEDGSRVLFTAALAAGQPPLVPGDTDMTSNLYMATVGCPSGEGEACVRSGETSEIGVTSLVQASHDPNAGGAANVKGIVRVAPDGSRVYFVASGDLLNAGEREALLREGRPLPSVGADNLYVYDGISDKTSFIADLCSGSELSGGVGDTRCPPGLDANRQNDSNLWLNNALGEAQTGGADGRFLVFSTYAQLLANDTDTAKDVYRYDAQTGALDRVSLGEDGYDANGNRNDSTEGTEKDRAIADATIRPGHWGDGPGVAAVRNQYEMDNRAVSEDGSRIVFTSAEPLSADASNGLANAYEWHEEPGWSEGRVSLVSTGSAIEAVGDVVISPAGSDVFFVTSQGLVAQDTDGALDVYDARLGSGFSLAPAAAQPCEGDACQGPLTNPAPLLVPGSVAQAPGGNFAAPAPAAAARTKAKTKKKARKKKAKARKAGRDRRARR